MEDKKIVMKTQCSLTQLALEIGVVYSEFENSLFASIDISTVREIQWRVLSGKYVFSPLILEIRPGAHSRVGLIHPLKIPDSTFIFTFVPKGTRISS